LLRYFIFVDTKREDSKCLYQSRDRGQGHLFHIVGNNRTSSPVSAKVNCKKGGKEEDRERERDQYREET
jgi:hypothetical protein